MATEVPHIWCLFSVANNYDQPDNNLEIFWFGKPSIEELSKVMGHPLNSSSDEDVCNVVSLWKGDEVKFRFGTSYRLEKVNEGGLLA